MKLAEQFVILSACRADLTDSVNKARTEHLYRRLVNLGLRPIPVQGCYQEEGQDKPEIESSFYVPLYPHSLISWCKLRQLACVEYDQDCILFVRNGEAMLSGYDKETGDNIAWFQEIGMFQEVTQIDLDIGAYTVFNDTNGSGETVRRIFQAL